MCFLFVFRGARGARAAAGAGAGVWAERRTRTMLASIKGFWKVCQYGDLYMVSNTRQAYRNKLNQSIYTIYKDFIFVLSSETEIELD